MGNDLIYHGGSQGMKGGDLPPRTGDTQAQDRPSRRGPFPQAPVTLPGSCHRVSQGPEVAVGQHLLAFPANQDRLGGGGAHVQP